MLSLLFNVALLAVWLRLLPQRDEKSFFNPYVAGGLSVTDRLVLFLKPVLGVLPPYAIAAVVLVFLLVFRGVAVSASGSVWVETLGLWSYAANLRSPAECVLFSFVSFGWLLQRLWMLDWALSSLAFGRRPSRAGMALSALAMPMSAVPRVPRLVLLLGVGAALGAAFAHVGLPAVSPDVGIRPSDVPPALGVLALASIIDVLGVASQLVMVFIVLSFIGALMRSKSALTVGNEGLDLLVGSVFPRPLQVGGFSFAPVVFFIAAEFLHLFGLAMLRQLVEPLAK